MSNDIIKFLRERDYILVKKLGNGACGETVLLRDDIIDEYFVCKKLAPFDEEFRVEFYNNFMREIKLLHKVLHQNVIRVFNYYLFPNNYTGYILMEYIQGEEIDDYLKQNPELINDIFIQSINGFRHLEEQKILHRDIRPQNLMVNADGTLKIIDFGFGKEVIGQRDFDKSMSLNLWCEAPKEFSEGIYDFKTEIYFIGKLYEKIVIENNIENFKYNKILNTMCSYNPIHRLESFITLEKEINTNIFIEIDFDDNEKETYRKFSNSLIEHITSIENDTKYQNDIDKILSELVTLHNNTLLEEYIPSSAPLIRIFLKGIFYFDKEGITVDNLENFINLLKTSSHKKKRIILSNIQNKLDAVNRYNHVEQDDLPF